MTKADVPINKAEVKKKSYSINHNVEPQSDLKVGSEDGDPGDSARQERLRRANEMQAKFKHEMASKSKKEEETVPLDNLSISRPESQNGHCCEEVTEGEAVQQGQTSELIVESKNIIWKFKRRIWNICKIISD